MADLGTAHDGNDRADEATLADLHRLGAVPPPRTEFVRSLKEEIMHHAPAVPYSVAPGSDQPLLPGARYWKPTKTLRHPVLSAFATAALLVVTLIGAYFAVLAPNGSNDGHPTAPAMAVASPPGATPTVPTACESTDIYFGCPRLIESVGHNHIVLASLDETARDVSQVQIQGWAVAPGASLDGADAGDAAGGVVVDVVLSGAYVATFDVPVVVHPGGVTNEAIQYLEAGAVVELGRGDSVSYQLGGLVEIRNPLSAQRIEFKRAVIYEGDISAFSATREGVTTRVETDGALPQPISAYGHEVTVGLWYLQVREGSYPPPRWQSDTTLVLGPVDPQRGPEGTEGFVLVLSEPMG